MTEPSNSESSSFPLFILSRIESHGHKGDRCLQPDLQHGKTDREAKTRRGMKRGEEEDEGGKRAGDGESSDGAKYAPSVTNDNSRVIMIMVLCDCSKKYYKMYIEVVESL